jgi:hypothetical protein
MRSIEDIPEIPDQETRLAEITVDCYGQYEELSAFEVYFTDALKPPFAALWCDPHDPDHAERVTVLGIGAVDQRRGILLAVRRQGGKERRVLAEQLWAKEAGSTNAVILDDYRAWGGVDPAWISPICSLRRPRSRWIWLPPNGRVGERGAGSSRKIQYARLLVDALDPAQVPRPFHLVLAHVLRCSRQRPGD